VDTIVLPDLPTAHEPTRATLHAYARAVGVIPRAHGISHPKWWHAALRVGPDGLVTDPVPLPGGGMLTVLMDLRSHRIAIHSSRAEPTFLDMAAGATGTELGDGLIAAMADHGLEGGFERSRFEDDEPRRYDRAAAAAYLEAFVAAHTIFERRRVTLGDRVGPVLVWPHGFDIAFEWFGTAAGDGETTPSQINLGFSPGREPYFYSSPWPFDDALREVPLPHGALWHTQGWSGAMLPYPPLQSDPLAAAKVADFAAAVFAAAAPGLGGT
jgi:hypothetical protein